MIRHALNVVPDDRKPLTARQQAILDFIKGYIFNYRMPPTYREIAENFGFFINAAKDHVWALERKGWLDIRRREGTKGKAGSMTRCIFLT